MDTVEQENVVFETVLCAEMTEDSDTAQKLADMLNVAFMKLIIEDGKPFELHAKVGKDGVIVTPYYEDNVLFSLNVVGSITVKEAEGGYRITPTRGDCPVTVVRDEYGIVETTGNRCLGQFEVVVDSFKALRKFCVAFFKDCREESRKAESHPKGYSEKVALEDWGKGKMIKFVLKQEQKKAEQTA